MKPKLPKQWRKDMRPFTHCSFVLYEREQQRLTTCITTAEEALTTTTDDHARECWADRLGEYHKGLERLEQMREDGLFVSEALCKGESGWFDWKKYFGAQVERLEREKFDLEQLMLKATTDQQRADTLAAISRVQFRIDNLSTKTLTPAHKQSVIARVLKEKTK